jgi:hypothetical protein
MSTAPLEHLPELRQTETRLAKVEPQSLARTTPARDPLDMLQAMIEKGVTTDNAAAFEQLVKLSEHMEDRRAEKEFSAAFVKLQSEIPKIKATKVIPGKGGVGVRSTFAPFEEIDAQARPICLANGFSYSFSEGDSPAGKITKICTLHHVSGHHRSNPYTVRIGSGPPGCSESQSDGSAHSYAKRGALCDCLNIVVTGMDNDARTEGGPITKEQSDDLSKRLANVGGDERAFLKFAGVETFDAIPVVKLEMLEEFLAKKERLYMQKMGAK